MNAYTEGLYDNGWLVLDFETTNLYKGNPSYDNKVVLGALCRGGNSRVMSFTNRFGVLSREIGRASVLVAHNAKFELKWLNKLGIDTSHLLVFDTILAEYTLLGNIKKPLDLGSVCKRYGLPSKDPFVDKLMKAGVCPSEIPEGMLKERCKKDVLTTKALAIRLKRELESRGLMPCYHTKGMLCKALADIELRGMKLDEDRVVAQYREAHDELMSVEAELDEFTGGINNNSPKQKAEYLYDVLGFKELKNRRGEPIRSPAGGRKTDQDTVMALKVENKKQERYVELVKKHSRLNADVTKALEKFYDCVRAGELLFANFNQTVSGTHRLTSSGTKHKVQFQNLHRKFKPLFTARNKGWLVAEVDGSQLEFRVAGCLGDDDNVRKTLKDKIDVHAITRDTINDHGGNVDRTGAKPHTFKPLYGGESGTPAEKAYYKAFREQYPGISATQEEWCTRVLNDGYIDMPTGLRFSWPHRSVDRNGYLNVRTKVCNYPVQYLATAEIIPIAVCNLKAAMEARNMRSFIVNTVHDSVIVEIHPEEIELFEELAVQAFTKETYDYLWENYGIDFDVVLGVEIKIGEHWSEGEEKQYEVENGKRLKRSD